MQIYPLLISLGGYAIIGLVLLILSGSMVVHLSRQTSKTLATKYLIHFFALIALSGGATILTNSLAHYSRLFAPWQDFWILAAGIALVRMVYSVPSHERLFEAKIVLGIVGSLVVLGLAYCLIFNYRFLFYWTPDVVASDAYYLLLPIGILLIIIIFLWRSYTFSIHDEKTTENAKTRGFWQHLVDPQGKNARTFRNLALALSLAFMPGLQTLLRFPSPFGFILSNIGSLLAVTAVSLVYLNYAPEIESFMAKLVGINLAALFLIVSVFGSYDVYKEEANIYDSTWQVTTSVRDMLLRSENINHTPSQVAYIISWDADHPDDETSYRQVYLDKNETGFDLNRLIDENRQGYLQERSQQVAGVLTQLADDDLFFLQRYRTYPIGSSYADYQSYIFTSGSKVYEIGYSSASVYRYINVVISEWLATIVFSCILVLIVFPLFFRRTLVVPLNNLLRGVRRVEQNELDVFVPPSFNDEIGLLTESFNRMVGSLGEAADVIQNRALDLEAEVNQRSIDLININVELKKENRNREIVEARLNSQLNYQRALSDCSQALLTMPDKNEDQQEILNNALERLRYVAQVSRAYVFQMFDDPEMGPCIGMLAEVCETGVPAKIANPVNQKFPLSRLPLNFASILEKGNPYGGLVKNIFASTPDLKEIFLNQSPPLLSMMLIPLFNKGQLWGFIGFDDCVNERFWNDQEISLLRTASEMIGSTLQRWEVETQLVTALENLEERVQERTSELSQSNIKLSAEIQQRLLAQRDLETRLRIERALANISTRLLEPVRIRENITGSLEDLAGFMEAWRIFLVEFDLETTNQIKDYFEWHRPEAPPMSEETVQDFMVSLAGLRDRLQNDETIYIKDTAQLRKNIDVDPGFLIERNVQSLVLSPITIDGKVHAIVGCSNLQSSADSVQMNLSALELVASMLKSLLQREDLIQSLEERVAERTHQLTTFMDMAMLSDQAQDLADILQPTLLSITRIANCDAVIIHIVNNENSSLELIAQRGIPLEFLQPLRRLELRAEFASWLMESGPSRYSDELIDDLIFPESFHIPEYRVIFASRLKTGRKSLGLLSCYRSDDQPFSPFQSTLLTALGELLGIVVENYRLRSEAEELATVEERQRLGREIHDAISQSVYSLSLFARSARDALDENDQKKLLNTLQDIESISLQAMREMRLLLYQLREFAHDDDIATELDARFKQVENRLGIQATCEINADIFLKNHTRHEIWRIIIEALNNSVKHARAAHVCVKIISRRGYLHISVKDDGIGFDIQSYIPGMGLKNIKTRAEHLGGQLEISSNLNQGTEINVKIPITSIGDKEGD